MVDLNTSKNMVSFGETNTNLKKAYTQEGTGIKNALIVGGSLIASVCGAHVANNYIPVSDKYVKVINEGKNLLGEEAIKMAKSQRGPLAIGIGLAVGALASFFGTKMLSDKKEV
ncbi:MAG: hypothetical protein WCK67_11800 [bacterium]